MSRHRIYAVFLMPILLCASPALGGYVSQVALTGDPAPGAFDGAEFNSFAAPSLNTVGDVAFLADLRTGTGGVVGRNNDEAIFGPTAGAGSELGLITRTDSVAPGVLDGAEFNFFGPPTLNALGDVAFLAGLRTGTGTTVDFNTNNAIFGPIAGAGSMLGLIARSNDLAPYVSDGARFSGSTRAGFAFGSPSLNSAGDVVFRANLREGTGDVVSGNNIAILGPSAGAGSALRLIAREGSPAPGLSDGAVFRTLATPIQNAVGDVVFSASLRTGTTVDLTIDGAIFGPSTGTGSALGLIAREGSPAPGVTDGAEFDRFGAYSINAAGDVVVRGFLRTGTGPAVGVYVDEAIFGPSAGAGSPLGLIAREGSPAPGVTDAVEFNQLYISALNAMGNMAILADLRPETGTPVGNGLDGALFAIVEGEFQLIVRQGDLVEVMLDDGGTVENRTISGIGFSGAGLNDAGELAFELRFTDDTEGIFIASPDASPFLTGDYNSDGLVSQGDLDLVLLNWGDSILPGGFNESAIPGGTPFDNAISQNELDGVLLNWGNGTLPSVNAIPEPTSAIAMLFTTAAYRRRSKRKLRFMR